MKKVNTVQSIYYRHIRKNLFNYGKHVIVIIACIMSMGTAIAQGESQQEYYKIVVNAPKIEIPEEVTINGIVKDEAGNPLVNAAIKAEYGEELLTDKNGAFSFTLKKERVTTQSIFISYDKLVTAVRSYHPSMINTTYDITLYKPAVCCKIKKCADLDLTSFTIHFKNNSSEIFNEVKKQLATITNGVKECPAAIIYLTLHSFSNKSLQKDGNNQLNAIKNYLIEQNGIAADRIKTNKVTDSISGNSIDVMAE